MQRNTQPELPGFEPLRPDRSKLEQAAAEQIKMLQDEGQLTDDHAILAQLVLDLAATVGTTINRGRLTIAGVQGAKLLMEALEALPKSESGSKLAAIVAELKAVS